MDFVILKINGRDVTGLHGDGLSPTEAIQALLGSQGPVVVEIVRRHGKEDSSSLVTALSSLLSSPQTTLTSSSTIGNTAKSGAERNDCGKTRSGRDDCDVTHSDWMVSCTNNDDVQTMEDHENLDISWKCGNDQRIPSDQGVFENATTRAHFEIFQTMVHCSLGLFSTGLILHDEFSSSLMTVDVVVHEVVRSSFADINGQINVGDRVLQVNGTTLRNSRHAELLFTRSQSSDVTLLIGRPRISTTDSELAENASNGYGIYENVYRCWQPQTGSEIERRRMHCANGSDGTNSDSSTTSGCSMTPPSSAGQKCTPIDKIPIYDAVDVAAGNDRREMTPVNVVQVGDARLSGWCQEVQNKQSLDSNKRITVNRELEELEHQLHRIRLRCRDMVDEDVIRQRQQQRRTVNDPLNVPEEAQFVDCSLQLMADKERQENNRAFKAPQSFHGTTEEIKPPLSGQPHQLQHRRLQRVAFRQMDTDEDVASGSNLVDMDESPVWVRNNDVSLRQFTPVDLIVGQPLCRNKRNAANSSVAASQPCIQIQKSGFPEDTRRKLSHRHSTSSVENVSLATNRCTGNRPRTTVDQTNIHKQPNAVIRPSSGHCLTTVPDSDRIVGKVPSACKLSTPAVQSSGVVRDMQPVKHYSAFSTTAASRYPNVEMMFNPDCQLQSVMKTQQFNGGDLGPPGPAAGLTDHSRSIQKVRIRRYTPVDPKRTDTTGAVNPNTVDQVSGPHAICSPARAKTVDMEIYKPDDLCERDTGYTDKRRRSHPVNAQQTTSLEQQSLRTATVRDGYATYDKVVPLEHRLSGPEKLSAAPSKYPKGNKSELDSPTFREENAIVLETSRVPMAVKIIVSGADCPVSRNTQAEGVVIRNRESTGNSSSSDWVVRRRSDGSRYIARRRPAGNTAYNQSQQQDHVTSALPRSSSSFNSSSNCQRIESETMQPEAELADAHNETYTRSRGYDKSRDRMALATVGGGGVSLRQRRRSRSAGRRTAAEERRIRRLSVAVHDDARTVLSGTTTTEDTFRAPTTRHGKERKRTRDKNRQQHHHQQQQQQQQGRDITTDSIVKREVNMRTKVTECDAVRLRSAGKCGNSAKANRPSSAVYENVVPYSEPVAAPGLPLGQRKRLSTLGLRNNNALFTVVTV